MVGITLSPEQIQQAPPEVRRWIEQQISGALGLSRPAPIVEAPARHLVGCDPEQARAILSLISRMLPVAGVFFELAHEPIGVTQQGLHVLRLDDIQHHCRLQSPDQVVACLEAIDEALRRVMGSPDVALTILDSSGHCVVADETAHSILLLWQEMVMPHDAVQPVTPVAAVPDRGAAPIFQSPYAISVPASAIGRPQQPAPRHDAREQTTGGRHDPHRRRHHDRQGHNRPSRRQRGQSGQAAQRARDQRPAHLRLPGHRSGHAE